MIMVNGELTLIKDASNSLRNLLSSKITELNGTGSIVLDSPGDISSPPTPFGLSIFLYQITENPFLKNQDYQYMPPESSNLFAPPLALDLYYLLTPYATDRDSEQLIMTKMMKTLYDNRILTGAALGDNLLDSGNNEIKIVFHNLSLSELYNLWGVFSGKSYKLSISCILTPLLIPSGQETSIPRILSSSKEFKQK
jgi:hypothetical protein